MKVFLKQYKYAETYTFTVSDRILICNTNAIYTDESYGRIYSMTKFKRRSKNESPLVGTYSSCLRACVYF